ncbi:MAG TPA: LysE family transporter, partial [Rhodocyclaceae bacterium]|nr:LysE family transporter [Rhodocyclaceae bacterium]
FVMVARTALAVSRLSGLGAALGMGLGAAVFATLALFGLHTLLNTVPALYWGLKLAGGAYLLYLGWRIFR